MDLSMLRHSFCQVARNLDLRSFVDRRSFTADDVIPGRAQELFLLSIIHHAECSLLTSGSLPDELQLISDPLFFAGSVDFDGIVVLGDDMIR